MDSIPQFGAVLPLFGHGASPVASGQGELYPLQISGIYPDGLDGTGSTFRANVETSSCRYICKSDRFHRPTRATEWIATSIASYLKIPVPDFAIVMNPKSGETYFGSKEIWGAANRFDAQTFLTTRPAYDPAIGDPYSWLSWYLSRLYAFDLFVGNPDRQVCNFLLVQEGSKRRLWAFDFDAADLSLIKTSNFPIVQTKTLSVGRLWRQHRHFDESSAFELIDWLGAISTTALESILAPIPDDWMSSDKREAFVDDWRKGASAARLTALRCGLKDGSLL